MNKKIGIGIVCAVVLLVAVAMVAARGYMSSPTPEPDIAMESTDTLASALFTKEHVVCAIEHTADAQLVSGNIYLSERGGKIRGDFSVRTASEEDGFEVDAHVIRDGEWNYLWGTFSTQGIKTRIVDEQELADLFTQDTGVSLDSDTSVRCTPWTVDSALFVPPQDIEFLDITASVDTLRQQMQQQQSAQGGDTCSLCNSVPEEGGAREQCLVAVGCR